MSLQIAPSILSADFLHLEDDIRRVDDAASYIHLDIMDGLMVPNISFGFSIVDSLKGVFKSPLDAHLMVMNPQDWIERLAADGVSMVSFHYEVSGKNTKAIIEKIHGCGMKAGIAINPDVPVNKLYRYIGLADFFVVMSVFAGFGGQKFIYESIDRISVLKKQIVRKGADTLIEVDGGVGLSNAGALREAGADILVSGNSIFKSADPTAAVASLRDA